MTTSKNRKKGKSWKTNKRRRRKVFKRRDIVASCVEDSYLMKEEYKIMKKCHFDLKGI